MAARYSGQSPEDCLKFAVACGAESTQRLGAGLIDRTEVERVVADVDVVRVAESAEVANYWPVYMREWTTWNHVRTAASLACAACAFVYALSTSG